MEMTNASVSLDSKVSIAIEQLLNEDYLFVGLVDPASGKVKICGGRLPLGQEESDDDYNIGYVEAVRELVQEDYFEVCVQALCLENILNKLKNSDRYICHFPAKIKEDGGMDILQWQCQHLNGAADCFIMTCTNASDVLDGEFDRLTGLYNQNGFLRHARICLDSGRYSRFLLARFDLDNFKMVNDTMGYDAGNRLLKDIGHAMISGQATIVSGRLDSDHFVVLIPEGEMTPEELYGSLEEWLGQYRLEFPLFAHMGVYCVEDLSEEVSVMCDKAMLALRSVKPMFAKRIAYYDNSLWDNAKRDQELSADMEKALAEGQFKVFFQPQINYEDGALIGAEALVRWEHPERGTLFPGEFIPLFESNGFITKLDEYVWDQSCAYMRKWMDSMDRYIPVSLSVNISRVDIYSHGLCEKLKGIVAKYNLPTDMLKLEVTESAYVQNPDQLISVVNELRREGFIMEMDDFGSGYSSLNILKDVPVDILKLDMKFLIGGEDEVRGGNILSSVIRMARWLKLPVIAEGVETRAQADYLKSLGCLYMQGYFFAKPMSADEFEEMLQNMHSGVIYRYQDVMLEGAAAFWDPSAQITLLFNSFVGGAAIMEYREGELEIVRANDQFYQELNTTREKYKPYQIKPLIRFNCKNRNAFLDMLEEAMHSGDEAECVVESLPYEAGEPGYWTRNKVRMLAKNSDGSCLFYVSVDNITESKELEKQLMASEEALRLSMSQTGRVVCGYDIATGTLTMPEDYAQRRSAPAVCRDVFHENIIAIPQDQDKLKDFFERIHRGEKTGSVELRVTSTHGKGYDWERADFVTVFADDGHPVRAMITVEDITHQKDIEAENARNRIVLEQTGACFFDYDVVTDTLHYQSTHKGIGLVKQDIPQYLEHIGSRDSTIHPEDRAAYEAMVRAVINDKPGSGTVEFKGDNWNTGYVMCRYNYTSLGDDMDRVYRVIGQINSIG